MALTISRLKDELQRTGTFLEEKEDAWLESKAYKI